MPETPPLPGREEWERFVQHYTDPRQRILVEDGKPVASAARTGVTQNVRGTRYPVGGLGAALVQVFFPQMSAFLYAPY